MQFTSFVFFSAVLAATTEWLSCEARTHKTYKSFKFGGDVSVGLYSVPPAVKRMYENRGGGGKSTNGHKKHHRNGATTLQTKQQRKQQREHEARQYNQQYLKSYRVQDYNTNYNYNYNTAVEPTYLAPAPPLRTDYTESSVAREEKVDSWDSDSSERSSAVPFAATEYANQYLKSRIRAGGEVDDLEMEYADKFLKRGLHLANNFSGPTGRWDERFMMTLKRFYASLMQNREPFLPEFNYRWKALSGEKPYRTDRLYTKHKSIDCGNLSMKLKMVGVIYGGHRNRVIKLYDKATRKYYAYKTYGNPDEFYAEQEKFLWIDHPYFVKAVCHRQDLDTGKPGILFDYVDGTSSWEYARTATLEQLKNISAQLLLAMEHLHWLGIVHADLKPENVMITADGTVQVIDLGFATHLPQSRRRRGTHTTMAPELHYLVPGRVHEAIDWWAYGSTVAMWFAFNNNFYNPDNKRFIPMDWQQDHFVDGVVPWKFTPELRNFLAIFFQPDPESRRFHTKRLLKQLRNDPFFNGVNWGGLVGGILN